MQTDMTSGKPMKIILNFAVPVFIGSIFQQFYNMMDAVLVGKFVGTKALAAVGATGTISFLILGFLMGVTTGFTVLTSQKYGAGKMDEVRQTVGNASILSLIVSILMTAISLLGMRWLLTFMNTPADIFEDSYSYIMICCGGILAQVLYNFLASVLRALGNSRTPLVFLIISAFLNIVLDLVFILVFHMGVAGAAWATVLSQGISGILCLLYIVKAVPELHMRKDDWKFRPETAKKQLGVGLPMGFQYSITAVGTMMVQSALNKLGSYAVAAFTAGSKVENIFAQVQVSLGTALATYNAQNIGAGRLDRIRKGFKDANVLGIIYSFAAGAVLFFGGKYFCYLFVSDSIESVFPMVDIYLKCVAIFLIPLYLIFALRSGIQGMGYGILPMMAGVTELLARAVVAVFASVKESYLGVCLASPVAWVAAALLLVFMYFYVMKDMKRRMPSKD